MSVSNLHKSFAEIEVLHGIDLDIHRGEVHAILGENGAGKSTLVKILSGFEELSSGTLQLIDESGIKTEVGRWDNALAEQAGVILIHQEFNLVEQLTVAENIFLGNEIKTGLFLDKKQMREKSSCYLQELQSDINPDDQVRKLPVSAKQMVEIAKSRSKNARLLILDEPTAVLAQKESQILFELITRLRDQGIAIVYISHKLDEIEQIADRISILRDGSLIGQYTGDELTKDDMARLMVGRELSSLFPVIPAPAAESETVLAVENLLIAGTGMAASFALKKGEVLGFSGLVGSGRTALLETVVGLRKPARANSGSVLLQGETVEFTNLAAARNRGIAYLTKDRKGSGLLLDKGLSLNFSLFSLRKFSHFLINKDREQQAFDRAVETFDIRIKDRAVTAGKLSGGNQQKLLLAKIMEAEPGIIIIDEPTRGIDIGTKSQIYHFLAELVAAGHSLILISSDITEIIGLSHRVAVMYNSEICGILEGEEINEHEIMRYATGLKNRSQPKPENANSTQQIKAG